MGAPVCNVDYPGVKFFPDLKFNIGGKEYVLPKESYANCGPNPLMSIVCGMLRMKCTIEDMGSTC